VNRFLVYILQLRIKMRYVQGKINRVADALSRLPADIKTSKIHAYQPPKHLKDKVFNSVVTEPIENSNTAELTTDCKGETNVWTGYRIQYDSAENEQKTLHKLNPNATIFVAFNLIDQNIIATVTPQENEEQQNPLNVIAPTRCSDKTAVRKAKGLQQ